MRLGGLLFLVVHISVAQFEPQKSGVKIAESLYLDSKEVSNLHLLEYEYYAKQDSTEEFHASVIPAINITENYRPAYYR